MKAIGCGHSLPRRGTTNEDSFYASVRLGLFLVADGVGGQAGGEVASRLAVRTVRAFFDRSDGEARDRAVGIARMDMAFRLAQREVRGRRVGAHDRMATTLVALHVCDGFAVVGHVGDSRVYRIRDGRASRLTLDHSLRAELEAVGAPPAAGLFSHVVTRAVGSDNADPDIRCVGVRPGDRFVLCTDGVHDVLDDQAIAGPPSRVPPDFAAAGLVGAALGAGSRDDMTAVVVEVR